jgi:thioesterase domain-containing protein
LSYRITAFFKANYTPTSLSLCLKKRSIGAEKSLPPYLTVLQSGDPSLVYLLIAPGGGSCASFLDLSQHLSPSATIVAVEHPNLASAHSSIDSDLKRYSVNDLGKMYANDLKRLFETMKECVLIGASFGGVVAVELYQHISEAGILVKSLNLLDSPWPTSESIVDVLKPSSVISNLFGDRVRDALFKHPHVTGQFPPDIPSQCASMISIINDALTHTNSDDRDAFERHDWRVLIRVYIENLHTLRKFTFSQDLRLEVPVLYFRATLNEASAGLDLWKVAIPQLSVHDIEADHASLYSGVNAQKVSVLISDNS